MIQQSKSLIAVLAAAGALVVADAAASAQPPPAPPAAPQTPAPAPPPSPAAEANALNRADFHPVAPPASPGASAHDAPLDPMLFKAQVILDRARFSPGVIDGRLGSNFKLALGQFQTANHLPATGDLDSLTWAALGRDQKPVAALYILTPPDVAGPFAPDVGENFVKLAALPQGPLYSRPSEMLAERFHMDEGVLIGLNPGVDFGKAGGQIVVAQPGSAEFVKGEVKRIEVSKAHAEVLAFGDKGQLLASYPATVGSTDRPSPSGTHKVNGVAWNTDYVYDPSKLHWGPRSHGKLHIKPGPNGPVGVVWIDLNAPSYGLHGTPDPAKIGKTASHGCVRLTNWDATALAHGVHPGTVVQFVGTRGG